MSQVPPGVRAIFFDAVGTLIHPDPSASSVYVEVGRKFGSQLEPAEVRRRFACAFREQEQADIATHYRTDEARERKRWQAIVASVLDDVGDRDACFRTLYDHFASPRAWRVESDAGQVLRALEEKGFLVGIASNFDHRLRDILQGIRELSWIRHLLISSEIGWKKPAPAFYACLCRQIDFPPSRVLFVGDDPVNDFQGASAGGLHALLVDPEHGAPGPRNTLARLFGL